MRVKDLAEIIAELPPEQQIKIIIEGRDGGTHTGVAFANVTMDHSTGVRELRFLSKAPTP